MEKVDPDCDKCPVPPLDESGRRIMEMYEMIDRLEGMIGAETVLNLYDATMNDLPLLAIVNEYDKLKKQEGE